ncbi:protein-glutamate methylesterase/protein-glutamine glutaminase [Neptunicella marina]|uniref:Protein-glutamate methylesterase/protein-glutamine glutaminase n=1 Tax=Neptunicella marina TaxID=2125989 RepID=A0A8J6M0M0_9ALTE|nr:chemotaxis response regulator protein-glutamate methylesterase [Neptunicella marina]MBC3764978.1 chemotaxis response regulator protein-glutamate methylesterase [Neptunicella marina]
MPYKVLIVDDSTFFRRRLKEILARDPDLQVVGEAKNGKEAIEQARILDPDVVTMDVEMPVMDGISAVKSLMASSPVPILMFSSLTHEGAQATLDAMEAGALDFLPKKFEDIARDRKEAIELLQQRVKAIAKRKSFSRTGIQATGRPRFAERVAQGKPPPPPAAKPVFMRSASARNQYQVLAIGTSTGGPAALQKLLCALPATFPYPIVLVQHMPGTFTSAFAERLNRLCHINVYEAQGGEILKPGVAYLAPGGKQMLVEGNKHAARLRITDTPKDRAMPYKPSVDLTFESVASVFGGQVLGVILTGMGADGREGCRKLKEHGAKIWSQDEHSCVVYGMPQAVANAGLSDAVYSIDEFADNILNEMRG